MILFLGGLAFVLPLLSGVVYFQTSKFQSAIQDQINHQIPGTIKWETAKLKLIQPGVEFHDIRLSDSNGNEILAMKQLNTSLSLVGLLRKTLVFSNIRMVSPLIYMSVDQDNTMNIISALIKEDDHPAQDQQSDVSGLPLPVIIESMHVENAHFELTVPHKAFNVSINRLDFQVMNADILNQSAELNLKLSDARITSQSIVHTFDRFEVKAGIKNNTVIFSNSALNAGKTSITLSGQIKDIFTTPLADLAINADVSLDQLNSLLKLGLPVKGRISSAFSLKGTLNNPIASLSVQSDSIIVSGHQIQQIKLISELKQGIILIKPSKALTEFGIISVSGKINTLKALPDGALTIMPDLDSISYLLDIDLTQTDFGIALGNKKQLAGNADTKIKIIGDGVDPKSLIAKWSSQMAVSRLKIPTLNQPIDLAIASEGELNQGILSLNTVEAKTLDAKLTGKGNLDIFTKSFNSQYDLSIENIGSLAARLNIDAKGVLSVHGKLSGDNKHQNGDLTIAGEALSFGESRIKQFSGTAVFAKNGQSVSGSSHIQASQAIFKDMIVGDILSDAIFSEGVVKIEKLELQNNQSKMGVSGTVHLINSKDKSINTDPVIDLLLKGKSIFLQDFLTDSTGQVALEGEMSGPVSDLKGHVKLTGENINIKETIIKKMGASISLSNRTIHMDQITVNTGIGALISGKGVFIPETQGFEIALYSNSFPLSSQPLLKTRGLDSGTLDIILNGYGTVSKPTLEGRIQIKDIIVQQEPLSDIDLKVNLKNRLLTAKGVAGGVVDAGYDLDQRWFDVKLDTQNMNLSPYLRMAEQNDFSGSFKGTAWVRGSLDQLSDIKVDLDLSDLLLRYKQKEIAKADTIKLSHDQGHLVMEKAVFQVFGKGQARIVGTGDGSGGSFENVDILFNADIPLDSVSGFFDGVEQAKGMTHVSGHIKGNLKNPEVTGKIAFSDIGLALPMLEQNLKNINALVELDRENIRITRFNGDLGDGTFSIAGQAGITGFKLKMFDLNIQAQNLPCNIPDVMDLRFNSKLAFSGTPEKSRLNGEIVLLEGRYYKDINLDLATIGQKKRQLQPESVSIKNPYLDKMDLEIAVIKQTPFVVDNNLASLTLSPDLQIHGTAARPLISGRAQIDSGVIRFQKKEFEIKKGVVDFVDPYKIVPFIDLEASAAVRSWIILLTVSGNPDNLAFNLTSSPQEEHSDILSLLIFDKTTRELRTAQGGSNFTPTQILAGFIAETMQKNLKGSTGLDSLNLEVNDADSKNGYGGTVTVGKELSRQLSVKYGVELLAGETVQKVSTDYKLLENIIMSGYQDSGGNFGGGLKYRLEFR